MAAPKGPEAEFMERLNVYMTMGLTLLAIMVLVWLTLRIRSWFVDSDDSAEPLQEMLTQFRQLKREGELSDEEYRLITQKLSPGLTPAATPQPKPKLNSSESGDSTDPSDA